MSQWNDLLSDIYYAGKINSILGEKPEGLTNKQWSDYLDNRFKAEQDKEIPFAGDL